ncbi:MAG: archaellar assembly protein FlaJ [Nitrospiraceae bacterium]|nr:archaellar assembly protein FlaJ [Nitrospiraceae bacterium]
MSEEKKAADEMLFLLTYMASIATADIDRNELFKHASEQKYSLSIYFERVHTLAAKWSYAYSKACKFISKKTKFLFLREFFGRMASAMSSGEPEKDFLRHEMTTMAEIYTNGYDRDLEALKKWTDGYTALLVSTTLIVMMILLSTMLYPIGNVHLTAFAIITVMIVSGGIGIFVIYDAAPSEVKTHSLVTGSKEQNIIKLLCKTLLPAGVIVTLALILLRVHLGYILLTAAAFAAPIGIMAVIDDGKITRRDSNYPAFTKMLGSLAGTMGINPDLAIDSLDRETAGSLEPLLDTLHKSLSLELNPRLCWERFIRDSGSELMNRFTRIFNDAVRLGGDPMEIGKIVSASSLAVVLLRMKRKPASANFVGLVILLHAVMVGLLIFIIELIIAFNNMVAEILKTSDIAGGVGGAVSTVGGMGSMAGLAGGVGSTSPAELTFLYQFTIAAIFVLTISNIIAAKVADGGATCKIFFYGSILTATSGLAMLVVPVLVSKMFTINM